MYVCMYVCIHVSMHVCVCVCVRMLLMPFACVNKRRLSPIVKCRPHDNCNQNAHNQDTNCVADLPTLILFMLARPRGSGGGDRLGLTFESSQLWREGPCKTKFKHTSYCISNMAIDEQSQTRKSIHFKTRLCMIPQLRGMILHEYPAAQSAEQMCGPCRKNYCDPLHYFGNTAKQLDVRVHRHLILDRVAFRSCGEGTTFSWRPWWKSSDTTRLQVQVPENQTNDRMRDWTIDGPSQRSSDQATTRSNDPAVERWNEWASKQWQMSYITWQGRASRASEQVTSVIHVKERFVQQTILFSNTLSDLTYDQPNMRMTDLAMHIYCTMLMTMNFYTSHTMFMFPCMIITFPPTKKDAGKKTMFHK